MKTAKIHEHNKLGEGSLLLVFWNGGSASVLWDGRNHIDINLFTYVESAQTAINFVRNFMDKLPFLKVALRDEQPRGFGRIVMYEKDLKAAKGRIPPWAAHLEKNE